MRVETENDISITTGSSFHALGLADADDLLVRADLIQSITTIIKKRHLTKSAVTSLIGMDQALVSFLVRGKITLFSTDRLLRALNDLGQDVELRIVPSQTGKGRIHVALGGGNDGTA